MENENRLIYGIMAVVTLSAAWRHFGVMSPDLLASWMAGLNFARGTYWDIYFGSGDLFTMRPPASWIWELKSDGHRGAIYPFIYPPLWAWFSSKLTMITSFEAIAFVGNILNPLLLMGSILLAARMSRVRMSRSLFLILGIAALATSVSAIVALEQNQPQIFVTFLLVLAAERTHARDPRYAGAALALAASIKLYPAFFVVIWIAQRNWNALVSFVLVGGVLGLTSILVAGWPLHAEFLQELSAISRTALVTFFTHSIDATVAQLFFQDEATYLLGLDEGAVAGWSVLAKSPLWLFLDKLSLIAVAAGLFVCAKRPVGHDPLFWPAAFVALALVSPLSWGYHYLSALVFLPVLVARFGARWGGLSVFVILWPTSIINITFENPYIPWTKIAQPGGTATMAIYLILLFSVARRRSNLVQNDRPKSTQKDSLPLGTVPAE